MMEQEQNSKHDFLLQTDSDSDIVPDEFVFIEVKPYFGRSNSTDDLALFIRSCQQAPMLELFIVEPSLGQTIDRLNEDLYTFESKVEEFDQLVDMLSITENSSYH